MQCLSKLVTGPYFNLFHRIGFNFKVLILGAQGLRSTYKLLESRLEVNRPGRLRNRDGCEPTHVGHWCDLCVGLIGAFFDEERQLQAGHRDTRLVAIRHAVVNEVAQELR